MWDLVSWSYTGGGPMGGLCTALGTGGSQKPLQCFFLTLRLWALRDDGSKGLVCGKSPVWPRTTEQLSPHLYIIQQCSNPNCRSSRMALNSSRCPWEQQLRSEVHRKKLVVPCFQDGGDGFLSPSLSNGKFPFSVPQVESTQASEKELWVCEQPNNQCVLTNCLR